jgi:hypothetical protein
MLLFQTGAFLASSANDGFVREGSNDPNVRIVESEERQLSASKGLLQVVAGRGLTGSVVHGGARLHQHDYFAIPAEGVLRQNE